MAGRPTKAGLDYFELDCHMDEKIELIEAEYGLKGFAIVVKLYQYIYSGFGYYGEWSPDISVLWAARYGGSHGGDFGKVGIASEEGSLPGFPKNLINDVVAASIRRGIFSREMFYKYHILTSSGIQKRYLRAVSRRENVELKNEYLLVKVGDNFKNVCRNSIYVDRNSINVDRNAQSRVEKSREEYNPSISPLTGFEEFWAAYPCKKSRHLAEQAYRDAVSFGVTEETLLICAKNYTKECRARKTEERYISHAHHFLNDRKYENYLPGTYKPDKGGTGFNNFIGRDYNMSDLEKKLLEAK